MNDGDEPEQGKNDLADIYGEDFAEVDQPELFPEKRQNFAPWHHPVKQLVRKTQWEALVTRLVKDNAPDGNVLRYFTLPGADLLDVRVISEGCAPLGVQIEYFGFDAGMQAVELNAPRIELESALRQAGRITANAVILPDRLEDIAVDQSQAARQLETRQPFHVINIDACDHLAYQPDGRQRSTFDAVQALLRHQMIATRPWLLFITTRVEPGLLAGPGDVMRQAVNDNLANAAGFGDALAAAIEADAALVQDALADVWANHDSKFLKLYAIGLGKVLLQFFHAQPNHPANVELASACAYRVYGDEPDMIALAFRITPDGPVVFQPGQVQQPDLAVEAVRAVRVAARAQAMRDLDGELEANAEVRETMARGSASLLRASNYDMDAYQAWLANHARRPMQIAAEVLTG
ncbi:hypothetical protein DRN02_011075 [Sphingomonas paucimobilis]|uniref:PP_RS20740 family protein n=1 Tax=Sphingomonas paucimobilis TaxID=13689 RepID=UPI000DE2776E|nr:hypothetical protein [Sphingomonas paucimobilis]QBE92501.1 hypothetical protein DRN02_011075 [Sphingomonas paucimobilis]